jgi:hypothetical protein
MVAVVRAPCKCRATARALPVLPAPVGRVVSLPARWLLPFELEASQRAVVMAERFLTDCCATASLLAFGCCEPAAAQLPADGWALAAEHFNIVLFDSSFAVLGQTGGGATTKDIAADGDGLAGLYRTLGGAGLYPDKWIHDPSGPSPLISFGPLVAFLQPRANRLATTRQFVYFLDDLGILSRCRKDILYQTGVSLTNVYSPLSINSSVSDIACNGRDLYFSIEVSGNHTHHVFAVDVEDPNYPVRPVASLPVGASPRHGPSLAIGRNGCLLAMDDPVLYAIDPLTGSLTPLMQKPTTPAFATSWFAGGWQILMAYNSWTDTVVVAPKDVTWTTIGPSTPIYASVPAGAPWQPVGGFLTGGYALVSTAVQPFEVFGRGCANGTGRDPRMVWQGIPRQGHSFSIALRDAEPGGFAFFWLGTSGAFWWPLGTLPFDAGVFGAPGCMVRVSIEAVFPVPVDANGRAAVAQAVPIDPALTGREFYAQAGSSSTANAVGLAASDALVIRLR